jgi:hypothetical protein
MAAHTKAGVGYNILLLDQAGWHVSKRLSIPDNITLLPLPPKSPELNPVESIWQFMRDNWLSNRVFKSYDDILDQSSTIAASPGISSGPLHFGKVDVGQQAMQPGFHSRARLCASAICAGVIFAAIPSLAFAASLSSTAAKVSHVYALV